MKGYEITTYGDRIADVYDDWHEDVPWLQTEESIELLAELAGPGPVLELAIGTGRLALPLAARGLEVRGVDASEDMVAKLREKPGGDAVPVTMGDFADVPVDGTYRLIFVAFNTFFALTSQDDQVRCFENVATHLAEEGVFALDVFVPDLARFDRGQRVSALKVETERVALDVARHDPVEQLVSGQHVLMSDEGLRFFPLALRYAFPAELDLMARLAGLRLRERWASWRREPFSSDSQRHVSVYGRAS
ncbi:MAG: SAM-dependent methyltransferase [Candidatus Rokuibacteriota bacterium]|nr:MAG: SAM-dependent methyltransferase [Candidatus Rokubacteria bacterium]